MDFRSGITRPLEWREATLGRLRDLVVEREAALLDALAADLGKPRFEGWVTEVGFVVAPGVPTDRVAALRLGQTRRSGTHGLLEYFWRSAPNVEAALQELAKRASLLDENSEFIWKRLPHSGLFGHRVRSHRRGRAEE